MTTTTLVASGHAPRYSVGSVNAAEFFVTMSAATTFFAGLGLVPLEHLIPLVLGEILAGALRGLAGQACIHPRFDDCRWCIDRHAVYRAALPCFPVILIHFLVDRQRDRPADCLLLYCHLSRTACGGCNGRRPGGKS